MFGQFKYKYFSNYLTDCQLASVDIVNGDAIRQTGWQSADFIKKQSQAW